MWLYALMQKLYIYTPFQSPCPVVKDCIHHKTPKARWRAVQWDQRSTSQVPYKSSIPWHHRLSSPPLEGVFTRKSYRCYSSQLWWNFMVFFKHLKWWWTHEFYGNLWNSWKFVSPTWYHLITHRRESSQPGSLQLQDTVHRDCLEAKRDFHMVG